jgi:hypothetical protein
MTLHRALPRFLIALFVGASAVPPLAGATAPPKYLFASPSYNIICFADSGSRVVNCQERGAGRYFDINLYIGGAMRRGNGGGDPGEEYVRSIPYGHTLSWTTARCTSSRIGMRCVLTRTGHGFLINRAGVHRI